MTKVTLFSEEPILIAGMEAVLDGSSTVSLTGVCSKINLLIEHVRTARPDVVLVELAPSVTLAVLSSLVSSFSLTRAVLWVGTIPTEFVSQALALGVRGILRKTLPLDLQVRCIERVAAGDLWVEQTLCAQLLSTRRIALTRRECELMTLVAQGQKNKEIAYALGITEGTVKVYLSRLFEKVGAKDRFELALFALKNFHGNQIGEPRAGGSTCAGPSGTPDAAPFEFRSLATLGTSARVS